MYANRTAKDAAHCTQLSSHAVDDDPLEDTLRFSGNRNLYSAGGFTTMRMTVLSLLCGFLFSVSAALPDALQGGARIDVPFKRQIAGAQCYVGSGANAGNAAFGFPARGPNQGLAFTIGPLQNSPGQENNKRYNGPGAYSNIGFMAKSDSGKTIYGYGTVVVSSDQQKGTFTFKSNAGNASGTWDCGHPLKH